ncbi:MAG: lipoyl(octanoyl) transferase LipB [Dehalococcoidia bacterium]
MDTCHILKPGLVDYLQAWELQKNLVHQVAAGHRSDTLLLLEHPHVYTIGRRGSREHILLSQERLDSMGVPVYDVDRGGEVTYHGPGQLVAYPIVNLRDWGGPLEYVRTLEQVMLKTLADYGITAGLIKGLTGVWVDQGKIGAIGVKISRGVSYHGLALNVNTNLDFYRHIVPCGAADKGVTSMKKLLGESIELDTVAYTLQYHFGRLMGFRIAEDDTSLLELMATLEPSPR